MKRRHMYNKIHAHISKTLNSNGRVGNNIRRLVIEKVPLFGTLMLKGKIAILSGAVTARVCECGNTYTHTEWTRAFLLSPYMSINLCEKYYRKVTRWKEKGRCENSSDSPKTSQNAAKSEDFTKSFTFFLLLCLCTYSAGF